MAQEVQTTLNYQAELNLIEWVWHQENKVKEHTQVEQAFGYECEASSSKNISASEYDRNPPPAEWSFTINSMSWWTEFKVVNWRLRVPLAWAYLATIKYRGGSTSNEITNYIKIDGETIFQKMTQDNNNDTTLEMVLNLGRYNMIEHWVSEYYKSSWYGGATGYLTLKLKKL